MVLGVLRELQRICKGFPAPNTGLHCQSLLEKNDTDSALYVQIFTAMLTEKEKGQMSWLLVHTHTHTYTIERDMMSC